MIVLHEMTVFKSLDSNKTSGSKLAIIKIMQDYTGEGLKGSKFICDLFPDIRERYFNINKTDYDIKSHFEYLERETIFKVNKMDDNSLTFTFEMNHDHYNNLDKALKDTGLNFKLSGASEIRNKKIDNLLG